MNTPKRFRRKAVAQPLKGDQQELIRQASRLSHRQYGEAFRKLVNR